MKAATAPEADQVLRPKVDYSGCCWVNGNVWFKIGLSKDQAKRLKRVALRLIKGKYSAGQSLWFLVNTALSHPEIIEHLMRVDAKAASGPEGETAYGLNLRKPEFLWDNKSRAALTQRN